MTHQFEIAILIIGLTLLVGIAIAQVALYVQAKKREIVIRSLKVYEGTKLISTTYYTYIGKELVRSETIIY